MADFAQGKIQAYVGPTELGASDELERVIIDFIDGAQVSLDVAVQEIDNERIAQALLDAVWREIDVRIVIEQSYVLEDKLLTLSGTDDEITAARLLAEWEAAPPEKFKNETNRKILSALLRTTADVKLDFNPKIFHQKFVVRDFRGVATPTTAVLSGSANFTDTDTHKNLNNVVIFSDPRIAEAYKVEYDEIRAGSFGRQRLRAIPSVYNLAGVPVKAVFAPDHTPELEIVKQMLKCTGRVDFAMFTFAGSSGIDDAMLMLAKAGLKVRGALDSGQGLQAWSAAKWLKDPNIELFLARSTPQFPVRKLHHKLMVIDEATTIAGSFNYTAPANEFNDENLFVIGSPHELKPNEGGPVDHDECARICKFFRSEIDRIVALSELYHPP